MKPFVILDRDGVLNKLLGPPPDSPMKISEIEILPGIPEALKQLNDLGYELCIATNQPAAAKGKISYEELIEINHSIVRQVEVAGAKILSSHICIHKEGDGCECRKPKSGLLQQIIEMYSVDIERSWMIGDRSVDIIAGYNLGFKTALINYLSIEKQKLIELNITPNYFGKDLENFAYYMV